MSEIPTPEEWATSMDAERVKQILKGYTETHDDRHGVEHLLNLAIDYGRRGRAIEAATLTRIVLQRRHDEALGGREPLLTLDDAIAWRQSQIQHHTKMLDRLQAMQELKDRTA